MNFSRSHIGMLWVISIFTGMIAPVLWVHEEVYPLALTSVKTVSYIILFILTLSFYFISISKWHIVQLLSVIIIWSLIYIAILYVWGDIYATKINEPINSIEWWIVFIMVGILSLTYSGFSNKIDTKSEFNILSDTIIGIVGALTLLWLSTLIIAASIGTKSIHKGDSILAKIQWEGSVFFASWITMSSAYPDLGSLLFDRKNDRLSYIIHTESGSLIYPESLFLTWSRAKQRLLGDKKIITSESWTWVDGMLIARAKDTEIQEWVLKINTGRWIRFITKTSDVYYTWATGWIWSFATSEDGKTVAWTQETLSGTILIQDGKSMSIWYRSMHGIHISKNGKDITSIWVSDQWDRYILKNWIPVETMRSEAVTWTWKSNWVHNIYVIDNAWILSVIYNWVSIGQEFEEIRDIFLEKNGNGYAFFGRKKGEEAYCFITRFKWSLCGLKWYMNPWFGADWMTIIYAWFKDNRWSIFRNTSILIWDTWYSRKDIKYDYFFYDATNPKQYIFIEKHGNEQYMLRKNGKVIPIVWKDIGLDIGFWYNNTAILSARDILWWRVIEL